MYGSVRLHRRACRELRRRLVDVNWSSLERVELLEGSVMIPRIFGGSRVHPTRTHVTRDHSHPGARAASTRHPIGYPDALQSRMRLCWLCRRLSQARLCSMVADQRTRFIHATTTLVTGDLKRLGTAFLALLALVDLHLPIGPVGCLSFNAVQPLQAALLQAERTTGVLVAH